VAQLRTSKWRALVGLLAAYAFALQIILTGVAAGQMAAVSGADPFAICYSEHGGDQQPAGTKTAHQTCCIVCATAPLAHLSAPTNTLAVAQLGNDVTFQGVSERVTPLVRLHSPRTSQGPPQVA
jgi:hypothetical protein